MFPNVAEVIVAHEGEFRTIFGQSLRPFMSSVTGFDVFKLDKMIKPKRNESTLEAIKRKYSDRAAALILDILHSRT